MLRGAFVRATAAVCHSFSVRSVSRMTSAVLLHKDGDTHFEFSFDYQDQKLGVTRQFNFRRSFDDTVEQFSGRIAANVAKIVEKKVMKKKRKALKKAQAGGEAVEDAEAEEEAAVKVQLVKQESGEPLEPLHVCRNVLFNMPILLRVNDCEFPVVVNPPLIVQIGLPKSIMSGFPVYPSPFVVQFAAREHCTFKWFCSKEVQTDAAKPMKDDDWEVVGDGFYYTPSTSAIGKHLRLVCTPFADGKEGVDKSCTSATPVEAGPGVCPFETRHNFTTERVNREGFRIVTYNILADLYADSDFTRTVLHPYCPPYALAIDYRKQLVMKELMGYNADLICLQEVDTKVFSGDLSPVLESVGFDGVFNRKGGEVNEGLASFFQRDKFELVSSECVILAEAIQNDPLFSDLWSKIQSNEALSKRVTERTTALQVVILDSKTEPSRRLVLGVTHLYFHPDADHIRVLQGGMCMMYLEKIVRSQEKAQQKDVTLILCGDFNSTPEFGIYQLMTTRLIPEDYLDWKSKEDERITGVTLTHPFQMDSACGTPEYTNYTSGFADCLDYIYYQKDKLEVQQVVPFPSTEELKQHTALPSIVFPSDHVALIADLAWRPL